MTTQTITLTATLAATHNATIASYDRYVERTMDLDIRAQHTEATWVVVDMPCITETHSIIETLKGQL